MSARKYKKSKNRTGYIERKIAYGTMNSISKFRSKLKNDWILTYDLRGILELIHFGSIVLFWMRFNILEIVCFVKLNVIHSGPDLSAQINFRQIIRIGKKFHNHAGNINIQILISIQ